MVTVLFVCLGNICRSPMAEAIFRQKVQQAGLESTIQVFSAATSHWEVGSQPHKGTRKILEQQGISYQGMRATQIQPSAGGVTSFFVTSTSISAFRFFVFVDRKSVV